MTKVQIRLERKGENPLETPMTIRIPNAATCLLLGLALMLMPSACANDDSHSTDAAIDALHEDAGEPTNAIRVELTWTTPGDSNENDEGEGAGSNLDLHMIHSAAPQNASTPDSDGDGAPDPPTSTTFMTAMRPIPSPIGARV